MDTIQSIITHIYNLLAADEELQTAMGGTVKLHLSFAPTDAPMPYIVHTVGLRESDHFAANEGTYTVNIYSSSTNASEVLSIRKRIVELLDRIKFDTDEVRGCELHKFSDDFVEEEESVCHYVIMFNLWVYRASEIDSILSR
jgi:hypothetical protein